MGKKYYLIALLLCSQALAGFESDEQAINELFSHENNGTNPIKVQDPAAHTFVFFINGTADFLAPNSSLDSPDLNVSRSLARDFSEIITQANRCGACNVVVYFAQPRAKHWWSSSPEWETILSVYSRGREILTRTVDPLQITNPEILSRLLRFTKVLFSKSTLHLIYRGHSFFPTAEQFDWNNPESPYDFEVFAQSLREASVRLGTITFAACDMAYLEVAKALHPFADYFIASQTGVLEIPSVGFRYDFLNRILNKPQENDKIAIIIGQNLLSAFRTTPDIHDAMMEYSQTIVQLDDFENLWSTWTTLNSRARLSDSVANQVRVFKGVSDRYLKAQPLELQKSLIEFLKLPLENPHALDFLQYLQLLAHEAFGAWKEVAESLASKIHDHVLVLDRPSYSKKSGLNFNY